MVSSHDFRRPSSSELIRSSSRPSSVEVIKFSANPFGPARLTGGSVLRPSDAADPSAITPPNGKVAEALPDDVFIDPGLPIPEDYDIDSIRALLQDPFHIWVYWSVREKIFNNLKRIFPTDIAQTFKPVLKISEAKLGTSSFIEVGHKGNYWLSVFPDRHYRIEVGVRSEERGYIRILEADEVRTPRGTVSMEVAEEPEYHISNREFAESLRVSGFAAFAGMLGPERVLRNLPPTVNQVISTAISGDELTDEQIASLPPRVRALLQEMRERGDDGLTSLALLHLLPEYLREAVGEFDESFDDALHPQHIAPRYLVGSSDNRPSPGRRQWMPSMADRPTSPTRSK